MPSAQQGPDPTAAETEHASPAQPDDLIAGAVGGEWAAWNKIICRYGRLIVHTAMRMGLSAADAADVAQLTWLRLWEHGGQIREPDRLSAWLVSTARREAMRLAAASGRFVLSADPSTEHRRSGTPAVCDDYPVEQEYDGVIAQALERLPVRYQTLLRLLSSDLELSYAEVAGLMGLPIGSIGPMRMRAIRMIEKTPEFASGSFPRLSPAKVAS